MSSRLPSFIRLTIAATALQLMLNLTTGNTLAAPTPAKPTSAQALPPLEKSWEDISIRLDVHNLTDDDTIGRVSEADLRKKIEEVNLVWSQCGVRFVPRKLQNLSARELRVPYRPQSQGDLSAIHSKIHPSADFDAIPLTIAGPWTFADGNMYMHGIGWIFTDSTSAKPVNMGAMVGANLMQGEHSHWLISHELGHALSLSHSTFPDNVMAGGDHLTVEQCQQVRSFADRSLKELVLTKVSPESRSSRVN